MFRIDIASADSVLPSPAAAGTGGYWTNGNPGTGSPPTIIDADWLNRVQEELITICSAQAGITLSKTNYTQVAQAILSGALNYSLDTGGSANTVVATLPITPVGLTQGLSVDVKIANTNTGASTLNVNGLGAHSITYQGAALTANVLVAGQIVTFTYDVATTSFQITSVTGAAGTLYVGSANTAGTANAQTVTVTPGGYARRTGNLISVVAGITNTGAMTLAVNGLTAVTIQKSSGSGIVNLAAGDWTNGDTYLLQDNGGTSLVLVGGTLPTFGSVAPLNIGFGLKNDGSGNLAVTPATQGVQGHRGALVIQTTSITAATIKAASVVVQDSSGNTYKIPVNVTYSTGTSGAGGIDTSVVQASKTYHEYVIYNPTAPSTAGILSLSATGPALPSGYTAWARVGFTMTDATGNLLFKIQYDNKADIVIGTNPSGPLLLASGGAGFNTAILVITAGLLASTAARIAIAAAFNSPNSQTGWVAPNTVYNSSGPPPIQWSSTVQGGAAYIFAEWALQSNDIYWYSTHSIQSTVQLMGWTDNL